MLENIKELCDSMKSEGIPIHGCNTDGVIFFAPEATEAQRIRAAEIARTPISKTAVASEPPMTDEEIRWLRDFRKSQVKA